MAIKTPSRERAGRRFAPPFLGAADSGRVPDLLVKTPQLPAALRAASEVPGLPFVIDHMAKPRIALGHEDAEWAAAMAPFADLTNVTCKLSGMVTEADWKGWRAQDLTPYAERVLGWFGADRLLFGSDWPVCLLAAPYDRVVRTARELLAGLSTRRSTRSSAGTRSACTASTWAGLYADRDP